MESLFWGQFVECGGGLFYIFPPPVSGCWSIWKSLVSFLSPVLLPGLSSPWQLWAGALSCRAQVLRNYEEGKVLREVKWDQLWTFKSRETGSSVYFLGQTNAATPLSLFKQDSGLAEYLFCRISSHQFSTWNILGWKAVFAGGEGCLMSVRQGKTGFLWFLLAYICMVIEYN